VSRSDDVVTDIDDDFREVQVLDDEVFDCEDDVLDFEELVADNI